LLPRFIDQLIGENKRCLEELLGGIFVRTSLNDDTSARFWHRLVMNDIDGTRAAFRERNFLRQKRFRPRLDLTQNLLFIVASTAILETR
jgi:hypothetical protein